MHLGHQFFVWHIGEDDFVFFVGHWHIPSFVRRTATSFLS
jgi:hypothetical protein